ncbi:11697_t:CDS:2 [Diversispora eburnea]|uniref:11697_t:CDS:1 n=1 Tax=Diversispora eburnea TaxID=1213867 RepID=A0A9N8ZF66_9GLOM|nr:11697_t:CDS:2 [Diversispora eburnea]
MINKYDFKKLQKENEQLKSHIEKLVNETSTLKSYVRKLSEEKGENINFENENVINDDDKPYEYWTDVETLQQQLYDLFNDDNQKDQSKSPEEIKTQKKYKRYGFLGVNIRQDI